MEQIRKIQLPARTDSRGTLVFLEEGVLPFEPARVFYMYGMDASTERGCHAHRKTKQFILALRGRFLIELTSGRETIKIELDSPTSGVYVPPMTWDKLSNFSEDAICLVAASEPYDESDYIREWSDYCEIVGIKIK